MKRVTLTVSGQAATRDLPADEALALARHLVGIYGAEAVRLGELPEVPAKKKGQQRGQAEA